MKEKQVKGLFCKIKGLGVEIEEIREKNEKKIIVVKRKFC